MNFLTYQMLAYKIASNFGGENFLVGWLKKSLSKEESSQLIKERHQPLLTVKKSIVSCDTLVFLKKRSYKKSALLIKLNNSAGIVKAFSVQFRGSIYVISSSITFINVYLAAKTIFLGLQKRFKTKLVLHGLRVRVDKIYKKSLILKLNLAHKIKWKNSKLKFFKLKKIKNAIFFKSSNILLHNIFLFIVRRFKMPDIYKGSGIRFFKEKIRFKKRKQFGSF